MRKLLTEFVIFSDLHAHNFRYGATRTTVPYKRGLYNSRLVDCLNVLEEIYSYCILHEIKHVLFGGDLFHQRTFVNLDVFNTVFDAIKRMEKVSITMVPGNHDYGDRLGNVHSLESFRSLPNVTVLHEMPRYLEEASNKVVAIVPVAYTDDVEVARRRLKFAGEFARSVPQPSILLAHLGMQGARVGSDYVLISDGDVGVDDVPYKDFSACFFGHYHEHQQLFGNGWYVGATHQHNWGDSGTRRGFLHVRVFADGVEFDQIETTAPRFINVSEGEEEIVDLCPGDFVRYHSKSGGVQDACSLGQKLNVSHVEVVSGARGDTEKLVLDNAALEPSKLVKVWTESRIEDEDTRKELIKLGTALITEAEGKIL